MPENVTNDELYRLLESHGDDLREIRKQTTITNGRVVAVETRVNGHDREIGELRKRGSHTHEQRRAGDRADAIALSIPMNAKTIMIGLSLLASMVMALITAALKANWL